MNELEVTILILSIFGAVGITTMNLLQLTTLVLTSTTIALIVGYFFYKLIEAKDYE